MKMSRVCSVCGARFTAKKANAVYCSPECRENPQFKYARALKRGGDKTCKKCGAQYDGPNYFFCRTCHTNMSYIHDEGSIAL